VAIIFITWVVKGPLLGLDVRVSISIPWCCVFTLQISVRTLHCLSCQPQGSGLATTGYKTGPSPTRRGSLSDHVWQTSVCISCQRLG